MNTPTTPTPETPETPEHPETPMTPGTKDMPQPPHPRFDDTLADEVFVDEPRTTQVPVDTPPPTAGPVGPRSAATAATASGPATATASRPVTTTAAQPAAEPEPTWLQGPAPFAIILGILGLVVAGATLIGELTDLSLPWNDLGPWSVVAAGLVVLLVGAIGLRSSRTRG